jgi:uncharacterized protein (DUF1810 family)
MKYNLDRFKYAQESCYGQVYEEIKNGEKTGHWMWFIFPQLSGLGISSNSRRYAIQNLDEAYEYLKDEILSSRLCELTEILILEVNGKTCQEIFGFTDSLKFHSSMTLFHIAVSKHSDLAVNQRFRSFEQAIIKYFDGKLDLRTIELLGE